MPNGLSVLDLPSNNNPGSSAFVHTFTEAGQDYKTPLGEVLADTIDLTSNTELTETQKNNLASQWPEAVATGSAQNLKVAQAGHIWQPNEVAFLIVTGQSNAQGFDLGSDTTSPGGTAPGVHDAPAGPLPNVKIVRTRANPIAFTDYNNTANVYTETNGSGAAGGLQMAAFVWQNLIDGGAILPDLYAINISDGSSGFNSDVASVGERKWAYDLKGSAGGDLAEWDQLWRLYFEDIPKTIAAIRAEGKEPVLVAQTWVQGEEDAQYASSALLYNDALENFYQMCSSVLGVANLPLYIPKLYTDNVVFPAANVATVNAAFDNLAARHPSVKVVEWSDNPDYDPDDSSYLGIFQSDKIHYTRDSQIWLAEKVLGRLTDDAPVANPVKASDVTAEINAAVNKQMRQITETLPLVASGASATSGDIFVGLGGLTKAIRSNGLLSANEGHFMLIERGFACGYRNQKAFISDFGFEMELGIIQLAQANQGVLRISGGGSAAACMPDNGTVSGFIFEIARPTAANTFEMRLGVSNDTDGMVWTATQSITYVSAADAQAVISLKASADGTTMMATYIAKDKTNSVLSFSQSGLPDSSDANSLLSPCVQVSAHVLSGTTRILAGDFTFIRLA